jgi:hypothetical protein
MPAPLFASEVEGEKLNWVEGMAIALSVYFYCLF